MKIRDQIIYLSCSRYINPSSDIWSRFAFLLWDFAMRKPKIRERYLCKYSLGFKGSHYYSLLLKGITTNIRIPDL